MALVVLTFTGCATSLADLRERPPVRSGVVPGAYRALAVCTVDGANSLPKTLILASASDHVYQLIDYQPEPRAAVIGFSGRPASAVVELLFTPDGPATTHVDLRLSFSDAIARRRYEGELWGVIEVCSARVRTRTSASPYEGGPTRRWLKVKQKGWTDAEDRWRRRITITGSTGGRSSP
jgi:hypothetical protein